MIANRPDWTLSRQRQWGTPMAFFVHKETGELHPRTVELLEQVALRVEQGGIEAWQTLDPRELLGDEADQYEKNRDTLDVWFDSGSTHATVLGGKDGAFAGSHGAELAWPADLYLEGSDQHRGWFHSSLLTGCMLYGQPPYKALLTHGFVVDGQGRKMSKSVGNVIAPQKVSDSLGAEILRLWVASTDYSGELSISDEILKRVVEGYRRIRNTLRFLLANLADFDAVSQAVPHGELFEIDRYALAMTAQMQAEISAHYERYDFHPAVSRLQTFCSEDLGAFYLDILKDRLYTTAAGSLARRSAQTALLEITQALLADGPDPVLHRRRSLEGTGCLGAEAPGRRRARHHLHRGLPQPAALCRRRGPDGQVDAPARDPRRSAAQARGSPHGRRHRLVAAGRSGPVRRQRRPGTAGQPGRRPALRADRVARHRACRRG